MNDPIWDVTVFTKNRERLLDGDIGEAFFQAVLLQAGERSLLSDEYFAVDGTLLEAWASVKSFRRKDAKPTAPPDDPGNATVDFHGEQRSNQTHESKTDPDARLARLPGDSQEMRASAWAGWGSLGTHFIKRKMVLSEASKPSMSSSP